MDGGPVFANPDIGVHQRDDGSWLLRSRTPLGPVERSVGAVLEGWARRTPDAPVLAERTADGSWRRVSYGEAWSTARAVGQALLERGLGPGRPVMVLSGNGVDHGLLTFGCYVSGVPVVPVSVAYSTQSADFGKLRHIARTTAPGLVFVSERAPYQRALDALDMATVEVVEGIDGLRRTVPGPEVDAAHAATGPDTVAKVLFTSGSTGIPKGVLNTHRMLCTNQQQLRQVWPFLTSEPAVLVDWLPWSHTFGGNHNLHMALWSGGTLYVDAGRPAPGLVDTTIANLRDVPPTVYTNVPAGFAALVPRLEGDAELARSFCSRLRVVLYAAAALPVELWERLQALVRRHADRPVPLTASWGSTETAPLATTAHFPLDGPGCIGVPVPGVTLKLAPTGRKLELRVDGPNVTPGYVGDPGLTEAAFDEEGFYRMGDAGRFLDPDRPERGIVFDGRVAEDFKLMTGTWVSVGTLRPQLVGAGAGVIQDAVITGQDRPEAGALVWLVPGADRDQLRAAVEKHNAANPHSSARMGRVLVLDEPPSIDGHEITDKGYINQRAVLERRAADVERLYAEPAGGDVLLFP
jgi:feruloyl-CoA synthase